MFLLHQIRDKQRPELIDAAEQRPAQHPCAKDYRHHDADLPGSVQRPHAALREPAMKVPRRLLLDP